MTGSVTLVSSSVSGVWESSTSSSASDSPVVSVSGVWDSVSSSVTGSVTLVSSSASGVWDSSTCSSASDSPVVSVSGSWDAGGLGNKSLGYGEVSFEVSRSTKLMIPENWPVLPRPSSKASVISVKFWSIPDKSSTSITLSSKLSDNSNGSVKSASRSLFPEIKLTVTSLPSAS